MSKIPKAMYKSVSSMTEDVKGFTLVIVLQADKLSVSKVLLPE